MPDLLSGILSGYGETTLKLQQQEQEQEMERRRRRLSIISQALPNITDPSLHAEAVALAEELATGKGKKKGGLGAILAALAGGQPGDIGQGEKLKEFMMRPRQATVAPGGTATLPEIPGMPPGVAATLPSEVTWPPTQGTITGPFPTPAESAAAATTVTEAQARAGADVKADLAAREARRLATEARGFGLTSPADIANYVRGHMVVPTGTTAVAGTMPGTALVGQIPADALGNPIDPNKEYHITRGPGGNVASVYPATEAPTHVAGGEFSPDADSSTGFSRLMRDWRTGKIVSVQRDILPPAGWAPTVSTTRSVRFVQQPDGTMVAVPVTTTSTRAKVMPGAGAAATGLPPIPGVGPGAPTGAGAGVGQPLGVVGRRPMVVAVKKDIANVKLALDFARQTRAILDEPGPDGIPLSQRTDLDQQARDWLKVRAQGALYNLGIKSGDPRYDRLNPLTSLLRVLVVSPYLKGLRNQLWVNQIQQHVPDATRHTPAAMAARLDVVTDALQKMKQDIMDQEGLTDETWQSVAAPITGVAKPTTQPKPTGRASPGQTWAEIKAQVLGGSTQPNR